MLSDAVTVHRDKFKTCDQSGFCKRNRAYADTAAQLGSKWESPYKLDAKSLTFKDGQLSGTILKSLSNSDEVVRLPLTVAFLESGTARVTVDEEKRQKGEITLRHDSKARKERYNEAAKWAIVGGLEPSKGAALSSDAESGTTKVRYGPAGAYEAVITHAPFAIDFRRDDQTHVRFNERGLMSLEHWRAKVEKEKKEGEEQAADVASQQPVEDESTWWEESFGGKSDSKPRGPESIALDISFPGYEHVYGIPGHASPLSLPETRYVLASFACGDGHCLIILQSSKRKLQGPLSILQSRCLRVRNEQSYGSLRCDSVDAGPSERLYRRRVLAQCRRNVDRCSEN